MAFKTKLAKNTEGLSVFYDTPDPEKGKTIVAELLKQVGAYYKVRTDTRSASLDISIEMLKNQNIANENKKVRIINEKRKIISDIELLKDKERLLKNSENYLVKQLQEVEENTKSIMNERSEMLKKGEKTDSVALLLYSNTVQQNISYMTSLQHSLEGNRLDQEKTKNELSRNEIELRNKDTELKDIDTEIMNNLEKINEQELRKIRIEGFKILQEPYAGTKPVAPRKKFNIAVAGVTSIFLGIFLAFLVEFVQKQRKSAVPRQASGPENP
jgi:capsular polysaccharide biosynthesis protein